MLSVDKRRLDSCLTGIEFPADVGTIVECAQGNSCPGDVIAQVESIPKHTLASRYELYCRLGDQSSCHLD